MIKPRSHQGLQMIITLSMLAKSHFHREYSFLESTSTLAVLSHLFSRHGTMEKIGYFIKRKDSQMSNHSRSFETYGVVQICWVGSNYSRNLTAYWDHSCLLILGEVYIIPLFF